MYIVILMTVMKYTTISISKLTRDALAAICTKDQTFDEVVRLLIEKKEDEIASNP